MAQEAGSGKLEVHVVTPEAEVWTGEADFLVATEANMIHPLAKIAPQHTYIPVPGIMESTGQTCACNKCPHMARNTLAAVRNCLLTGQPEIVWRPYFDRAQAVLRKSLLE